jgi:alkanesulfonate monooxygenase SsuD/methylene tetrahydromethanopterin reductase-like flavin-dependent oxidoreductase (luciferase family)
LWTQPTVEFEGKFVRAKSVGILLRPVQTPRPPIWIGGFSHRAAQRAAEFGDAWTPNCYTYPPDRPGARNSLTLEEFRKEADWARRESTRVRNKPLRIVLSSGPVLEVLDSIVHPDRKISDLDAFSGRGTVDELIEEFTVFKQAGADAFYVTFSGSSLSDYLHNARRFMGEVAPELH